LSIQAVIGGIMGLFIHKREKHIVNNIKRHADLVAETVKVFLKALSYYIDGDLEKSKILTMETHNREKEADHYKREINKEMYEGAFMPSVREVLFIALDFIDKVANEAEKGGDFLTLIEPEIPQEIKEYLKKMIELTKLCADKLKDGIYNLFINAQEVFEDTKQIEHLEGEVDKYVWKSIETVFNDEKIVKFSEKMMLRELILNVNALTNRMEDASDRLDVIALKLRT
jgi:predicted phosphate transport protein (TIGR00153 family)